MIGRPFSLKAVVGNRFLIHWHNLAHLGVRNLSFRAKHCRNQFGFFPKKFPVGFISIFWLVSFFEDLLELLFHRGFYRLFLRELAFLCRFGFWLQSLLLFFLFSLLRFLFFLLGFFFLLSFFCGLFLLFGFHKLLIIVLVHTFYQFCLLFFLFYYF